MDVVSMQRALRKNASATLVLMVGYFADSIQLKIIYISVVKHKFVSYINPFILRFLFSSTKLSNDEVMRK